MCDGAADLSDAAIMFGGVGVLYHTNFALLGHRLLLLRGNPP